MELCSNGEGEGGEEQVVVVGDQGGVGGKGDCGARLHFLCHLSMLCWGGGIGGLDWSENECVVRVEGR